MEVENGIITVRAFSVPAYVDQLDNERYSRPYYVRLDEETNRIGVGPRERSFTLADSYHRLRQVSFFTIDIDEFIDLWQRVVFADVREDGVEDENISWSIDDVYEFEAGLRHIMPDDLYGFRAPCGMEVYLEPLEAEQFVEALLDLEPARVPQTA